MTRIEIDGDDEDLPYDDTDEAEAFIGDQEWENTEVYKSMRQRVPKGWMILKVTRYNGQTLRDIEQYFHANAVGRWNTLEWRGNCAYSVALAFEDFTDAVVFRMKYER